MAELNKREMRERLGNVEQIREILFGSQLRGYDERLDKMEADFAALKQEIHDRLDKIKGSLSAEVQAIADSLEKKLKYLSLTTHDETTKLWQKIDQNTQKHYNTIEALNKSFNGRANTMRDELAQTREQVQAEVQLLKVKIFEELEKSFASLRETKVSRADLAEVLFDLCIKVKGAEFVPDLREAMESRLQADFLLPDQATSDEAEANEPAPGF